jgi:hypothetical protein
MNRTLIVTALVGAFAALAACNNVGDCPASITPGGSCSGNNLQCPYTLAASSGDDAGGTATSCVCTDGTWVCPSASSGDDGGVDAAEDAGSDSTVESGADAEGGDASPDVTPEATTESPEASPEAASEAAPDAAPEGSSEASSDAAGQ